MMTVSRKSILKQAQQNDYVAYSPEGDFYLNLRGKYDYMEAPYFTSQELEAAGLIVFPSCKEMLDSYIVPIIMEKAKTSGIAIPSYYISNGYFEPPVIIDPINPFMIRSRTVLSANNIERIAKSMTRNFTYAVCCQEIPPGAKIKKFRSVLGWSRQKQFRELASQIWGIFKMPLAKVRVIVTTENEILLSDISHLPFEDLNEQELNHLLQEVRWEK